MIGVIYVDTREPGGFEIEDVKVLERRGGTGQL
jgi:hypothetical protein